MKFFEPSKEWVKALKPYVGNRIVYDVGCGDGHITEALHRAGIPTVGIEFLPGDALTERIAARREQEDPPQFLVGNAFEYTELLRERVALPMFCRPCHGGWVERLMRTTFENPLSRVEIQPQEFLYVGLERNLEADLGDLKRQLLPLPVGAEGEKTWRVSASGFLLSLSWHHLVRLEDDTVLWVLWQKSPREDSLSLDTKGDWYFDWKTRLRTPVVEVLESACVSSEHLLDMRRTSAYRQFEPMQHDTSIWEGLLSQTGRFVRCGYWKHDRCLSDYLNISHETACIEGWARVSVYKGSDCPITGTPFSGKFEKPLSEAQAKRLLEMNDAYLKQHPRQPEGDWAQRLHALAQSDTVQAIDEVYEQFQVLGGGVPDCILLKGLQPEKLGAEVIVACLIATLAQKTHPERQAFLERAMPVLAAEPEGAEHIVEGLV